MAEPKRRTSRSKTASRRAANRNIKAKNLSKCAKCGEPKLPHVMCSNCGTYKGIEVLEVKDKTKKHDHKH